MIKERKGISMLKRVLALVFVVAILFAFASCQKKGGIYPDLPWDAITFEFEEYTESVATYSTIKWGERVYIPYGNLEDALKEGDLTDCLGYTSANGEVNKSSRVFTISGDKDHNYLLICNVENSAYIPVIYRAMDTRHQEVARPEIVNDPFYSYWK